jgi:hypothetical protein
MLALLLLLAQVTGGEASESTVDACALLSAPIRWNGRLVRARGIIEFQGGEEGWPWLVSDQCPPIVQVGKGRFSNAIVMQHPENKRLLVHRVDYATDEDAYERLAKLFAKKARTARVAATVVGVFEVRTPTGNSKGEPAIGGFGHLGGVAAQIIVKTITDMQVISGADSAQKTDR